MARDQPRVDGNVDPDGSDALAELAASAPRYQFPYGNDIREHKEQQGKYGVLHAAEYEWSNQRCTREAYGDSKKHAKGRHLSRSDRNRRSLYYHSTWMSTEPAVRCIREIPVYNRFDPDYAADVVENFPDPTLWVVGRESSVVLYAWTVNAPALVERMASIREAYMADLEPGDEADIFAPAGPDEIGVAEGADTFPGTVGVNVRPDDPDALDVEKGDKALIRAWWD